MVLFDGEDLHLQTPPLSSFTISPESLEYCLKNGRCNTWKHNLDNAVNTAIGQVEVPAVESERFMGCCLP